ncbi:hypothetical protein AB0F17_32065 [Nonomuraea sp. NPDC026600]|uniref:hypothetical protein n=1 Tax=Nonomuraea sp. NPDC026600 TaxID=3155363 RepID=UPI0033DAF926
MSNHRAVVVNSGDEQRMNKDPGSSGRYLARQRGDHHTGPENDGHCPPGVQANATPHPMTRSETHSLAAASEDETGSVPRTRFHRHSTNYEPRAEP